MLIRSLIFWLAPTTFINNTKQQNLKIRQTDIQTPQIGLNQNEIKIEDARISKPVKKVYKPIHKFKIKTDSSNIRNTIGITDEPVIKANIDIINKVKSTKTQQVSDSIINKNEN